jgi:hypothetical protein
VACKHSQAGYFEGPNKHGCCAQVLRALHPSLGGHPGASLDEVVARLARAKARPFVCSS